MRPWKALHWLGLAPVLQSSAYRSSLSFTLPFAIWGLHPSPNQCLPFSTSTSPTTGSYTYRIAASFSGKHKHFNPKTDLRSFEVKESSSRKNTRKQRPRSGEDAFFVASIGGSNNVAFGVADGVGGWAESGIDPSDFSHGLCEYMSSIAQDTNLSTTKRVYAGELLQKGYDSVVRDKSITAGGSTACIAVGGSDGALEVANLGDSGFLHLRPNAITYSSPPQIHAFNTPYQLSVIPPHIAARSRIFGGKQLQDYPRDAHVSNHRVKHGDVLVFATDGVWDNVSSGDLLKIVGRNMVGFNAWSMEEGSAQVSKQLTNMTRSGSIPREFENSVQATLAVAIAGEAKLASLDDKAESPFAREVKRFNPHEDYRGGKVDDICVVVAIVVQDGA